MGRGFLAHARRHKLLWYIAFATTVSVMVQIFVGDALHDLLY